MGVKQPDFAVEWWPIEKVRPYEKNPRQIKDAAIAKVAASLREFGWRQPIVVDAEGVIVVGHTRWRAAKPAGYDQVPVHVAAGLTPEQIKAYRLADNRTSEETEWDAGLLAAEIGDLKVSGFDVLLTAFDGLELDRLLGGGERAREVGDSVVEPPSDPVSRPGDLWILGDHRIQCADSCSAEDVKLTLAGAVPVLMITDPPYGVDYDPAWRVKYEQRRAEQGHRVIGKNQVGQVRNDGRADWRQAWALYAGDVAYIWHASWHTAEVLAGLNAAGFERRTLIIWAKQSFVMSRGHYHYQHELCWYAVRKGAKAHWRGDRKQTTLWQVANLNPITGGDRSEKKTGHGTQKPLELMRRPMLNHTERGDLVYDPFLGSGSTLIAAEELGRRCYGQDIDPAYVDVVITRWQTVTGQEARLGEDGPAFADVAAERRPLDKDS